jgi:hypothetical protein
MNLKLQNPFRGSMEPWPLASRVGRFVLTAVAVSFLDISSRTFRSVVQHNTGLADPQALPERPRRIAEWLCHISTALLFLAIVFAFARQYHALWPLFLAVAVCALCGRYLRRTVWGLPNAFHEPTGRWGQVLRRLLWVIRHGHR